MISMVNVFLGNKSLKWTIAPLKFKDEVFLGRHKGGNLEDLCVKVLIPGMTEKRYRFGETPILVGRSIECHLAICHAAVPRELCKVWLEDEGRVVRVEACPGLTNPLIENGKEVVGGINGSNLVFKVGPVELSFCTGFHVGEDEREAGKQAKKRLFKIILAVVLSAGVIGFGLVPQRDKHPEVQLLLPESPFGSITPTLIKKDNTENLSKARLLESRANELLSRRDGEVGSKVAAVRLLEQANGLLVHVGDLAQSRRLEVRLAKLKTQFEGEYRKEMLLLQGLIVQNNSKAASLCAKRLLAFLGDENTQGKAYLDRIIAQGEGGS